MIAAVASKGSGGGGFDIPTGRQGRASPLFGATSFSQKMLILEVWNTQPLVEYQRCMSTLLQPNNMTGSPDSVGFNIFLGGPLHPSPTAEANET